MPAHHTCRTASTLPQRRLLATAIGLAMSASAWSDTAAPTGQPLQLPTIAVETGPAATGYKADAVSSPKYTAPLADTPQTITVVPESLIEDQQATSLRDVLRNVPGISIQAGEGGTPLGDQLSIRGFSARTDLFVDGVRDFGGYSRDPFNLEQVEVVKGPASGYTGRGSTGGSINLSSKAPRLRDFIEGSVGFGSSDYNRNTLDLNQVLGEHSALRLNLMTHDAETPDRDVTENHRWGVAPSIAFGLDTPTRLTLSYFEMRENNTPDYGIPWVPATNTALAPWADRPAPVDYSNFYGLKDRDYEDVTNRMGTVEIAHDFSDAATVRNLTRYGVTDRDSLVTAPRFSSNASTDIRRADWKSRDQVDTVFANQTDLTLAFRTGSIEHALVAGIEYAQEREDNRSRTLIGAVPPVTDLFYPNPSDPFLGDIVKTGYMAQSWTESRAVYVFDTLTLNEHWQVNGGLRYDRFEADYETAGSSTTPSIDYDREDDMTSWSLGVVFKPRPNGSIYVGYGTSFNPSAEGLSLADSLTATNSVNLDPEESTTLELGTKWELLQRRLLLSAAVFETLKTNARTQNPLDPLDTVVLEGEQRVQGLELGLSGQLTDRWEIFAGYTYLASEILDSRDRLTEDGNELSNTPEHTVNLWSTWQLPAGFEAGVGAQFVDERYSSNANTRTADDYWLFDAMLAYTVSPELTLRLNLRNLADESYIDRVGGGHFVPGPGRSAVLAAEFKF